MRVIWSLVCFLIALAAGQNVTAEQEAAAERAAELQLLAAMPECGLACLSTAIAASPCSATDIACSCSNATITAQLELCVASSCSIRNQLSTKNTTETLCSQPVRNRTYLVSYPGVIGCVIAVLAFVLRMMSKVTSPCTGYARVQADWWWDDAVISLAMMLVIPMSCLSVVLANAGLGKDIWTLPFENITRILKIYYFDEDLYLAGLPLIKISMLLTYLRIFQSKRFRLAVYIVIGLNIAYGIAFVLVSVFQCRPISLAWEHWDEEHVGVCNNINAQGWTSAAFNVGLDIITIGLPMPLLWNMNFSKSKKFLVMLMFGVGFFVTVVSILRLQILIHFGSSQNLTWDYTSVGYWSTIEIHAAVFCACMPAMRQLVRRFFPKLMGSSTEESHGAVQSGFSGRTAVGSGLGKAQPEVFVRSRGPDESDVIPLQAVPSERVQSPTKASVNRHPRNSSHPYSEQTTWFNGSEDAIHPTPRPISPLSAHKDGKSF